LVIAAGPHARQPEFQPDRLDAVLLEELARDGRATWAELGAARTFVEEVIGRSAPAVIENYM
jgi:hypothetical protein